MRQYEMYEIEVDGDIPQSSKALAAPTAVFTLNGKNIKIKGFYSGNGKYKIRFYPQETGTYIWNICPTLKDGEREASLYGKLTGEEECMPAASDGMVQTKGVHFAFESGKRYLAFGTTIYAMIHQTQEIMSETFQTLKTAPFNKIRFCVFPKHYDYSHNEPEYFAFEKKDGKFDINSPCFEFWNALEDAIVKLDQMGIQSDLILFHPYDRWGFSKLTLDECKIYLDYLVRRLSAYPNIWWSLANEYDLVEHFERKWWYEFAELVHANDPYGHLLSNHNCLPYWDFHNEYVTHCSIQDSCVERVPELQKTYGKPVIFDECCYEGNIEHSWGNISAFEMVNRFWITCVNGGYCTHGETYLDKNDILWWAKGGTLHGESPKRIAFLKNLLEELPGDLEPIPGFWGFVTEDFILQKQKNPSKDENVFIKGLTEIPMERVYRFRDKESISHSHCGEATYIKYYGRNCTAKGTMELPEDKKYRIEIIDVWEMTRTSVISNASGKVELTLPGREGIALLATISEDSI